MKHDGVPRWHGTGWASVTPQPARNGFEPGRSALVLRDRAPAHNDEISVVDGTTFVVSDALGDILPGSVFPRDLPAHGGDLRHQPAASKRPSRHSDTGARAIPGWPLA